ncbi:MAG: hypothetical protein ACJAQZ_004750, partial [Planctomycetota bacterium]
PQAALARGLWFEPGTVRRLNLTADQFVCIAMQTPR